MTKPWHDGWVLFTAACAIVAGLTLIPPEYGRWVALALLVVVVVTPAVSRSHRGATKPQEAREVSDS